MKAGFPLVQQSDEAFVETKPSCADMLDHLVKNIINQQAGLLFF